MLLKGVSRQMFKGVTPKISQGRDSMLRLAAKVYVSLSARDMGQREWGKGGVKGHHTVNAAFERSFFPLNLWRRYFQAYLLSPSLYLYTDVIKQAGCEHIAMMAAAHTFPSKMLLKSLGFGVKLLHGTVALSDSSFSYFTIRDYRFLLMLYVRFTL